MNYSHFADNPSGSLVPTVHNEKAFLPDPLPPAISLEPALGPFGEAMQAVGHLNAIIRQLPNPYMFIRPLQRIEALTSSSMEGTIASVDELVMAEFWAENSVTDPAREVYNYVKALDYAQNELSKIPLSHRLIKRTHEILMSGVSSHRGANKRPGEYKIDQNFIGGKNIHNARFIPVPPGLTVEAMDHLEAYINEDEQNGIPPLINAALIHYQFETIHPFADGNGRVGRILVPVYLLQKGVLQSPILYISPSIEEDKDMYIDLMYKVSSSSQWLEWIIYFLNVVKSACEESIETINAMVALQERYRKKSHEISRSPTTFKIVEYLFERPIVTIPMAASVAGVTYPSAANAINMLEENGILRHLRNTNNPKMFIAPEIIKLSAGISEN